MSTSVDIAPLTSESIAALPTPHSAPLAEKGRSVPAKKRRRASSAASEGDAEEEEEACCDETRSVDSEDAGSLVDFIVEDPPDDADEEDRESVESEEPKTEEEARQRDLDGIDASNIVSGKRTRRQTVRYDQTVFNTDEYRRMMLDDVPEDEMHALQDGDDDDDDAESDEESDDSYHEEEEEDEDSTSDDEEDTSAPPPTPSSSRHGGRTPKPPA